jgi:hypothetical protein
MHNLQTNTSFSTTSVSLDVECGRVTEYVNRRQKLRILFEIATAFSSIERPEVCCGLEVVELELEGDES